MSLINFAYDGEVGPKQFTWHWHVNSYDNKFYPINGVFEDCYYDYHAPLQTVFEKHNIPILPTKRKSERAFTCKR